MAAGGAWSAVAEPTASAVADATSDVEDGGLLQHVGNPNKSVGGGGPG